MRDVVGTQDRSQRKRRPHLVVVLALPGVVGFELGLAHRLLNADALADPGPAPYRVVHVSVDDGPVLTSAGYQVLPTHPVSTLAEADTVVIPGLNTHPVLDSGVLDTQTTRALDLVPAQARWISICTGAFVLAAYGLLAGRQCTTHWAHSAQFAQVFPALDLDPDVLFVDTGKVLTSAGNAAGIDLLLHVLRSDLGAATAASVARGCVVAPWRDGGQAQFIRRPVPDAAAGGTAATRAWMADHLGEDLTLARMAQHAGTSVRSFTRAFREETGNTAGDWLTGARVDRARELLETTDASVDRVAAECGFGTAASMRHHFRRRIGLAPAAYRRRFVADSTP